MRFCLQGILVADALQKKTLFYVLKNQNGKNPGKNMLYQ